MKRTLHVLAAAVLVATVRLVGAEGFKPYPGAKLEEKATQAARQEAVKSGMANMQPAIYLTADTFEKVVAYYKGMAKEYAMPGRKGSTKLPTGQELKEAYFIFDAADDIAASKLWAKVQRPYIGSIKFAAGAVQYEDVRDVTAIVLAETK